MDSDEELEAYKDLIAGSSSENNSNAQSESGSDGGDEKEQ